MRDFDISAAAAWIAVPDADSDKYSRGVLGVLTGSDRFPGAAVLGVEAAARTGVGMIRYVGPARAADFVLRARPEVVTVDGRVQAWLIGSGTSPERTFTETARIARYLEQGLPVVLDAGALDLVEVATGPAVVTPHAGELVTLLGRYGITVDRQAVSDDPERWAATAAATIDATVLLKGSTTVVADADGLRHVVREGPPWLATAGSGDVLGGVLGALVATHHVEIAEDSGVLADLAATAAWLHGAAGRAVGGPLVALDITAHLREVMVKTIAAL